MSACPRLAAFTLIEIMVAIGIIVVILAIGIPSVYQQLHKDSMRQAIKDITEMCGEARSRAVLEGKVAELRIRPMERQFTVVTGSPQTTGESTYSFREDELVETRGGESSVQTRTLSPHIFIEFIGVNLLADLQELEELSCNFYPNGTSDELVILLRSDQGEIRKITTEVVTGIADVEVIK